MEIESVLARIRPGDRKAFEEVVKCFQKPLFGFLGHMGLPKAVCEEIAQETFVRAWINLGRYDPVISMFSTWLYTIAMNLAMNELNKAARRLEISGVYIFPSLHGTRIPQNRWAASNRHF